VVIPVGVQYQNYAKEVAGILWDAGLYAEADVSDETLQKKIVSSVLLLDVYSEVDSFSP
jgi:threonyl-tRNA synthetase